MGSGNIYYRQCVLIKEKKGVCLEQTTFIPEKLAEVGQALRLRTALGDWDDGWIVEWVASVRVAEADLPDYRKKIRNHRKNTGDSLPKV